LPSDLGQPARQRVREHDRQRHQLGRLVAGEPVHHPLVAGALGLLLFLPLSRDAAHPARDVGGLSVDRDQHAGVLVVDAELGVRVADALEHAPGDRLDVGEAARGHLAGDDHRARRRQALHGDARIGVGLEQRVQDRVADLVADLVRVSLGDGFTGDERLPAPGHRRNLRVGWLANGKRA
jgi:hypothetical protein